MAHRTASTRRGLDPQTPSESAPLLSLFLRYCSNSSGRLWSMLSGEITDVCNLESLPNCRNDAAPFYIFPPVVKYVRISRYSPHISYASLFASAAVFHCYSMNPLNRWTVVYVSALLGFICSVFPYVFVLSLHRLLSVGHCWARASYKLPMMMMMIVGWVCAWVGLEMF